MKLYIPILLLMMQYAPTEQLTGINLVKQNQIYTGYSTWILSTTVDVNILQNRTYAVSSSLRRMRSMFNSATETYISSINVNYNNNEPGINTTVVRQRERLVNAARAFQERLNTLIDIEIQRTRSLTRKIRIKINTLSRLLHVKSTYVENVDSLTLAEEF